MLTSLLLTIVAAAPQAPLATGIPTSQAQDARLATSTSAAPCLSAYAAPSSATTSGPLTTPVKISATDKIELAGTYYPPAGAKKGERCPGVLFVHDKGGDMTALAGLAEFMQKKGFAVLTLDLRGHGTSATEKLSWKDADEKTRAALWAFASKDIAAGLLFLAEQKEVHTSNLILLAHGAGGSLAVSHAVDDKAVRAVVLLDARPEDESYDLVKGVTNLGGLPTLLAAPKDRRDASQRVEAAAEKDNDGLDFVELVVMRSEGSEFLGDERLPGAILKWVKPHVAE